MPSPSSDDDVRAQRWLELLRVGTDEQKMQARQQLALIFERRQMWDEATELVISNIRAGQTTPNNFRWLARLYQAQGRPDLAAEAAAEASKRMPVPLSSPTASATPASAPGYSLPASDVVARLRIDSAAEKVVWTTFPINTTVTISLVIWFVWGWQAALSALPWIYVCLAALRTSLPFGTNGQELLGKVFLFTNLNPLEIPLWLVVGLALANTFLGGLGWLLWPAGVFLAIACFVAAVAIDTIVRAAFPVRNPFGL